MPFPSIFHALEISIKNLKYNTKSCLFILSSSYCEGQNIMVHVILAHKGDSIKYQTDNNKSISVR